LASEISQQHGQADVIIAINVLAHVPTPKEFLSGVRALLAPSGVFVVEFPHLLSMVDSCEFDTIYHEHFSYFSFTTVVEMFKECGLLVTRVDELSSHGGSLRVRAVRSGGVAKADKSVDDLLKRESDRGMRSQEFYREFERAAIDVKNRLLEFLLKQRVLDNLVVGYGAAAKGNTLLNFAGIRSDLLKVVADRNPAKVGKFLPGSRIPIVAESELKQLEPDFVLILAWNLRDEIERQLSYVRKWGGKFVVAVPELIVW
jgi:hypothetical protein